MAATFDIMASSDSGSRRLRVLARQCCIFFFVTTSLQIIVLCYPLQYPGRIYPQCWVKFAANQVAGRSHKKPVQKASGEGDSAVIIVFHPSICMGKAMRRGGNGWKVDDANVSMRSMWKARERTYYPTKSERSQPRARHVECGVAFVRARGYPALDPHAEQGP